MTLLPDIKSINEAHQRIRPHVHCTPVLTSSRLNQQTGARLYFKCENLQRTGAFKLRGASNAVWSLPEALAGTGVATHSSGNHGAALALAARERGIPAHIVVPSNAVASKIEAIHAYGGIIHSCEPTQVAREAGLADVIKETGANAVPPYDDARIIAGQGTAAMELLQQVKEIDTLIAPIGGGGLSSGTAIVGKSQPQPLRVFGAEPSGANDTARSLSQGAVIDDFVPDTICDGLRAKLGMMNFAVLQKNLDRVIEVDDNETIAALRMIWHTMKIVIEPSCATVVAAILKQPEVFRGHAVGVILSGGNVDLDKLPWIRQ